MAVSVKKKELSYLDKNRFFDRDKSPLPARTVFRLTDLAPQTTSCPDFNSKTGLPRLSCLHQTAIEGQPGGFRQAGVPVAA
jgi:hypothetical protein